MRKILYAAAFAMLAVSCNKDADVTASKPVAKSGTSATFELFDETIEKSYSFSFTDLYTEDAAYTYEELSTVEDSSAKFLVLLTPEYFDIVPSASGLDFIVSLKKPAYLILTSNPGTPVSLNSGTTITVNCICKRGGGNCTPSYSYITPYIVEATCVPDIDCKKCKMQATRENIAQNSSGIIYAK